MVLQEEINGVYTQLEEPINNSFQWADYLVFAAVLIISLGIGVFYAFVGRKSQSTAEFLMASRSMGTLPVALSLLASFMSAITLLGRSRAILYHWLLTENCPNIYLDSIQIASTHCAPIATQFWQL